MRRAALYVWNRGALVIVDDGEPPVIVETVDIEDAATADPAALARIVAEQGAEVALFFGVTGQPAPTVAFAANMERACSALGVEIRGVGEAARKAHRGAARKLCPPGAGSEATRDALAMVLADMGGQKDERPGGGVPSPSSEPLGLRGAAAGSPTGPDGAGLARATSTGAAEPTPPAAAPQGPRVAGIDPGEKDIAVCIGAITGDLKAPLAYVASLPIVLEDDATDEQLDVAAGKAIDFCELHGVSRAAVERALMVNCKPDESGPRIAGKAAHLLRAQYVGGIIRGGLRAAKTGTEPLIPGKVESVTSTKGRNLVRRMAGRPCKSSEPWEPCALLAFGGTIPAGVGEHVLDAAVAAVWAVRPEEAPAAPRAPREPGKPRTSKHAAEKAKRAAEREAAGCVCPGARHAAGCPIQVAANAKRAAAMVGNVNARKGEP